MTGTIKIKYFLRFLTETEQDIEPLKSSPPKCHIIFWHFFYSDSKKGINFSLYHWINTLTVTYATVPVMQGDSDNRQGITVLTKVILQTVDKCILFKLDLSTLRWKLPYSGLSTNIEKHWCNKMVNVNTEPKTCSRLLLSLLYQITFYMLFVEKAYLCWHECFKMYFSLDSFVLLGFGVWLSCIVLISSFEIWAYKNVF